VGREGLLGEWVSEVVEGIEIVVPIVGARYRVRD